VSARPRRSRPAQGGGELPRGRQSTQRSAESWESARQELKALASMPRRSLLEDGLSLRLERFWLFMAQALRGAASEDNVCKTFELGGSIDCIGDVAFTRDEITARFLKQRDLPSVVWHILLICWLGAGGPQQETYRWLRSEKLACKYADTDAALVAEMYKAVECRVRERGLQNVFHGDSRCVRWRLDPRQQGEPVLLEWFRAVPMIVAKLEEGISPQKLEAALRSVHFIGELTAKELYVHLHYARPEVADTMLHCPVGGGARAGAELVLFGDLEGGQARAPKRKQESLLEAPADPPASLQERSCPSNSSGPAAAQAVKALKEIAGFVGWAQEHVPCLKDACCEYRRSAGHRNDPLRNCRLVRRQLLDIADVEVMLCYYKNYAKLKGRFGEGPIPNTATPRGWMRRNSAALQPRASSAPHAQ